MELSLKNVNSKLDGIKLFEICNNKYLEKLITSDLLNTHPWSDFDNEKMHLEFYKQQSTPYKYNNIDDSYVLIPVKYKRSNGLDFGRVFPIKSLSLCSIRRDATSSIKT